MKSKKYKVIIALVILLIFSAIAYYFYVKPKPAASTKVVWGTAASDRYLWPMMISTARFILPDGVSVEVSEFGNEQYSALAGKWGFGKGEDHGNNDPLPVQLHVDWLSLRERSWFKGEFILPEKKLDSLFKAVAGNQLIIGLDTAGKVIVWVKGKVDKKELAVFKAKGYQPDWQHIDLSSKETEEGFIDRVYSKIASAERDAISLVQPLSEQKAKDGIYSGIYEFIGELTIEQEKFLLVHKQKDSMALVDLGGVPKNLAQGDLIRLDWKTRMHSANREQVAPAQRQVLLNASIFKKGKLSRLYEQGFPEPEGEYNTEHISENGKALMKRTVSYYLANSKDEDIRNEVDKHKRKFKFIVEELQVNGARGYKVAVTPVVPEPSFAHWVYSIPGRPFSLLEWDQTGLKGQPE